MTSVNKTLNIFHDQMYKIRATKLKEFEAQRESIPHAGSERPKTGSEGTKRISLQNLKIRLLKN